MADVFKRARYKLQQAEVALAHLRMAAGEIALLLRRGAVDEDRLKLLLDTRFFSCLGLAKSAYNIIADAENDPHGNAIHHWRMNDVGLTGRTQFNRMIKLRDIDVHYGRSQEVLSMMMPANDRDWTYQSRPSYAALGLSRPATQHTNPDGSVESSYEGLQATRGLHITVAGKRCEAANACERFIAQLREMIDAVAGADVAGP